MHDGVSIQDKRAFKMILHHSFYTEKDERNIGKSQKYWWLKLISKRSLYFALQI